MKNADQLAPALRVAFMESNEVMIEGFLDGTEISQGIYKTAEKTVVLPATEVVTTNEFFDYDAKYNGQVQEISPARLSPETAEEVAKTTSRIYDILHANGIIRIDYITVSYTHLLMHLREYGLNVSHVVRGGERLGTYYFEEAVAMRNSRVVYDRKNSSFYTLKRGMVKWEKVLADAAVFH